MSDPEAWVWRIIVQEGGESALVKLIAGKEKRKEGTSKTRERGKGEGFIRCPTKIESA